MRDAHGGGHSQARVSPRVILIAVASSLTLAVVDEGQAPSTSGPQTTAIRFYAATDSPKASQSGTDRHGGRLEEEQEAEEQQQQQQQQQQRR